MDQKCHDLILTEAVNESTMIDQSHFVGPDLRHPCHSEPRDFQLASTIQEDMPGTLPRLK